MTDELNELRGIARMTTEPGFRVEAMAKTVEKGALCRAIETTAQALRPLAEQEPGLTGKHSEELHQALRAIGSTICPHLSPKQAGAWVDGVMLALSDLSPRAVVAAARKAIHTPMEFPGQVHAEVRRITVEIEQRQCDALRRLYAVKAEIERALIPQPRLEAPDDDAPLTIEQVRPLFFGPLGKFYIDAARRHGWIGEEMIAALEAERDAAAETQATQH